MLEGFLFVASPETPEGDCFVDPRKCKHFREPGVELSFKSSLL